MNRFPKYFPGPASLLLVFLGLAACGPMENTVTRGIVQEPFAVSPDGDTIHRFTLTNANGLSVSAITYGGIITALKTPDRNGELADIVLGFHDLDGYLNDSPYFGAIVGRYGNRIAQARFELGGELFSLAANDGENHLHGGIRGFDKVIWKGEAEVGETELRLHLTYLSPDGDEGYPGNLTTSVSYTLTDADELMVDYEAQTDRSTPVNLTQHSYFNLAGPGGGDILDHLLTIPADRFTPVDETLIPTGELAPVAGTPFDFREPHAIGDRIEAQDQQLLFGGGYDHNFILNGTSAGSGDLVLAARVAEPLTGRTMEVFTTEPGLQFYSGNFLDGTLVGKGGVTYQHRTGFCLETQHFPDSPNQAAFPSTILEPGDRYRSRTVFKFGILEE